MTSPDRSARWRLDRVRRGPPPTRVHLDALDAAMADLIAEVTAPPPRHLSADAWDARLCTMLDGLLTDVTRIVRRT